MTDERHEELLRQVLHAQVDDLAPDTDALRRIRARVRPEPRWVRWRRPALALLGAAAVAVAGTLVGLDLTGGGNSVLKTPERVGGGGTPTPAQSGSPADTPTPGAAAATGPVVAIWPYQTDAYAAQLAANGPTWQKDPQQVALRFVGSYLGFPAVDKVVSTSSSADIPTVVLGKTSASGKTVPVTSVQLIQERGVYGAVAATAERLAITSPAEKATVDSPLTVRGTIVGVDESICSYLKPASAPDTAKSCVGGGGGLGGGAPGRWSTTLTFGASGQRSAALVATTDDASGAPGPSQLVARLVVLPSGTTSIGPAATYPQSFVGVQNDRIAVFSSSDGTLVRYLTDPGPGSTDSAPTLSLDGQTAYFVRTGKPCATFLYYVDVGGSSAPTLIRTVDARVLSVAVSPGATALAWTQQDCATGGQSLLVAPLAGAAQTVASFPAQPPEFIGAPSFSADGSLVAVGEGTNTANRFVAIYPVSGSAQANAPCPSSDPCRATHPAYDAGGALTYETDTGPQGSVVRYADGTVTMLFDLPGNVDALDSLDVSKDGDVILGTTGGTYRWSAGQLVKISDADLQPSW